MKISVGVGGAHKLAHSNFVGVGGAWKRIIGGWVGVDGAWKRWHAPVSTPTVLARSVTVAPTNPAATLTWETNGDITIEGSPFATTTSEWGGGGGSAFEISFTKTTGEATGTFDQWLSLGTARVLNLFSTAPGLEESTGTYTIRIAGGGYTFGTGNWTLRVTQEES